MIRKEKHISVRIFDFERVFICEKPTDPHSIRLDGILKAMDALMLFNNSFFHRNNFNPCEVSQYERSVKIYDVMRDYIFKLMPREKGFVHPTLNVHQEHRKKEHLDTKILRFFQKWQPTASRPIDQASTMINLNSDLQALYKENVLLSKDTPKTFLQYITLLKGDRLQL